MKASRQLSITLKNTPFKKSLNHVEIKVIDHIACLEKQIENLVSDDRMFYFSQFGVLNKYYRNFYSGEESLISKFGELSRHVPK